MLLWMKQNAAAWACCVLRGIYALLTMNLQLTAFCASAIPLYFALRILLGYIQRKIVSFFYGLTYLLEISYWVNKLENWLEAEPEKVEPPPAFFGELTLEMLLQWIKTSNLPQLVGYCILVYLAVKIVLRICRFIGKWFSRLEMHLGCSFAEKMMPGSTLEFAAKMPSFQVEIWVRRGTKTFMSGQGFNTKTGIFTAHHVVEDADEVVLKTESGNVTVEASGFVQLEGDVAVYIPTAQEIGTLSLSQAKIVNVSTPTIKAGLMVKVQAFGQRTMGLLESSESFGLCQYKGSTIKGFSGAPYHVGKVVYGMHIGGATVNLGFESAYLYMLARKFNEDTDDYLFDQIMTEGKDYTWERSPYDPDEARVKMDGLYYNVDMDLVRKLNSGKRMKKEVQYKMPDYEREANDVDELPLAPRGALVYKDSKNLMRPHAAPARGRGKRWDRESVLDSLTTSQSETDSESQDESDASSLDGHQQTRAPPKSRSTFTQESMKPSEAGPSHQQKKRRNRRSKQRSKATQPGKQESQEQIPSRVFSRKNSTRQS